MPGRQSAACAGDQGGQWFLTHAVPQTLRQVEQTFRLIERGHAAFLQGLRQASSAVQDRAEAMVAANARMARMWSSMVAADSGGLRRSQVVSGDVLDGNHRIIIVGLNCRDNCSSAGIALSAAFDFPATDLTRHAEAAAVGRFVKLPIDRPGRGAIEILGLILRRDHRVAVDPMNLHDALSHLMRYLGSRNDLDPREVAIVAVGTGAARMEGGYPLLLQLLGQAGYPGLVYQPLDPGARLNDAALARIGITGRVDDPLPAWPAAGASWTDADERQVRAVSEPVGAADTFISGRTTYLSGDDSDQG